MKHLEKAFSGSNKFWQYLLMIFLAFFIAQIVGGIPYAIYVGFTGGASSTNGAAQNTELLLMIIPFLFSVLFFCFLIKPIHGRSFNSLIYGGNRFKWKSLFIGFIVWFALQAVYLTVSYVIDPDNFVFQFNIKTFIPLFIISITLIPFQAGLEEILCRGYLAQGVGVLTRNRWLVIIVPTVLFSLLHFANPEIEEYGFWASMPQYFLMGFTLGLISVLDDGIEMAIGMHSANNIFASLFISFHSSVMQTPAVFFMQTMDIKMENIALTVQLIIFVLIAVKTQKWNFKILSRKIEPEENQLTNEIDLDENKIDL